MSLVLHDLTLRRDGVLFLDGVSASFRRGRLATVIGRTLAGKTSLLRALAGLQGLDSGEIELDGRRFTNLPVWQRDVAMVYQQFVNYPHLSVFENVAFPLRQRRVAEAELRSRVMRQLETVELAGFAKRRPSELSGGQQQRVALARALVRGASILLLDEPLVNLDYKLREQMREEFRALFAQQANTILIYNTTEPVEAMMLGDVVIAMHEGRILQAGLPAELFERPASALVAAIINDPPINLIAGVVGAGVVGADAITLDGGGQLALPAHFAKLPPGRYRFGIRANEITTGDEGGLNCRVVFTEVSGSETFIHFKAPFGEGVLQREGVHAIAVDAVVPLVIPPERLFCFSAEGEGRLVIAPQGGA